MIDFIGDIHGHSDELEGLLKKLGYFSKNGVYSHSERKVLFVGDYIDRGPKIRETLKTVRSMVESGNAIALKGNHEYNALCFHFEDPDGGHLRKHTIKNIYQHCKTIEQFRNKQHEYEDYLEWFKTLPLYYETDTFRAVHASWDTSTIDYLRDVLVEDRLTDALIYESVKKGTMLYHAIEDTLKGKEIEMPLGIHFFDKDDHKRTEMRIKWWENPANSTYKSISILSIDNLPDTPIDLLNMPKSTYYSKDEKPVFFGHYWLEGQPTLYRENICCLDYSVAKKGKLVAYQYHNERLLSNTRLIF